jgi:riboflavin biosynthesis pyrimidine reductase
MTAPVPPHGPAATPAPQPEARPGALPDLELLLPAARAVPRTAREEDLAALYAHPAGLVRANMVSSVDGAAWGADHRSGTINDAADFRVFRVLRALADVVVVGAGTARAEGYTPLRRPAGLEHLAPRAGGSPAPLELALVSRTGAVPPALAEADRPPLVITGEAGAPAARAALPTDRVVVAPGAAPGEVDLAAALAGLAGRGLSRVLTEGGPGLLASLVGAHLVHEVCLSTTGRFEGPGAGRIVAGPGGAPPVPARLGHLLAERATSTLLARWVLDAGA